jgi:hypothetical protein
LGLCCSSLHADGRDACERVGVNTGVAVTYGQGGRLVETGMGLKPRGGVGDTVRGDQIDHAGRRGPGVILEFSGLEAAAAAAATVAKPAAGQQQNYDDDEQDREHGHLPAQLGWLAH